MPQHFEDGQRPAQLRAQQSAALSRRQTLKLAAAVIAFTHGRVEAQVPNVQQFAQRAMPRQTMLVALDGIDEIAFQYRGRRVAVSPGQLLDALEGK